MKNIIKEFKTFISRGNIIDLAIAIVIGGAFKAIINSLVKDVITPVLSLVIGEEGFDNYKYVITEGNELLGVTENAIYYGMFFQSVIDFFLIATVIFVVIKFINKANEAATKIGEEIEELATDIFDDSKPKMEELLGDIKDLLKKSDTKDNKE